MVRDDLVPDFLSSGKSSRKPVIIRIITRSGTFSIIFQMSWECHNKAIIQEERDSAAGPFCSK